MKQGQDSKKMLGLLGIAFKMLVKNKAKFSGMIIGIIFSSFIMMQQPAIYEGVIDRVTGLISSVGGIDLWVMSPSTQFVETPTIFNDEDIYRIRSVASVQWAIMLHKVILGGYHQKTGVSQDWNIIGVDNNTLTGLPVKMEQGERDDINLPGAMIIDTLGVKQISPKGERVKIKVGDEINIVDKENTVVAIAEAIPDLAIHPIAYMTEDNLSHLALHSPAFILVKAVAGAPIKELAKEIYSKTGYIAYTPKQFTRLTIDYYERRTPLLINFAVIAILGFIIGFITMGQIFYTFTLGHLYQFGMLKILGTTNSSLIKMLLFQAGIVSLVGYLIGLLLVTLFGVVTHNTVIAFHLTWQILLVAAVAIIFIAIFSVALSVKKVLRFDTVELCRSDL